MYTYTHIYLHLYMSIFYGAIEYTHIHIQIYTYSHVHIYVYAHVRTHVCGGRLSRGGAGCHGMYTCTHLRMVHMYMHTHIYGRYGIYIYLLVHIHTCKHIHMDAHVYIRVPLKRRGWALWLTLKSACARLLKHINMSWNTHKSTYTNIHTYMYRECLSRGGAGRHGIHTYTCTHTHISTTWNLHIFTYANIHTCTRIYV